MTTTEEPKTKTTTTTTVSPPPPPAVGVPLMNRMTTDLLECSALGSFMFLINELRLMNKKQQEDSSSDSDSNSSKEEEKSSDVIFDPLYKFPLLPSSIEKIVLSKATILIEKQGQRRHDAHLQMFEFFRNYNKNLAINGSVDGGNSSSSSEKEKQEGVHILDYHDEHESEGQIVYSIVVDHISKRLIVAFRGSVTKGDWEANFDANHRKIENPLYDSEEEDTTDKQKQPQFMVVHRGFYDYMYKPFTEEEEEEEEDNGQKTKTTTTVIDSIVSNVVLQLQQYPNYSIFTTGVSLGGALTIVFSFFVAACYQQQLPGVITCYSFASPKVGTVSFRKAYQSLEKSGRLRLLRLANINDPVVLLPRDPCQCIPYLDGLLCAFCLLSNQERIYRHVGLGMLLFPIVTDDDDDANDYKPPQFKHTKFESSHNCCRVWCSDIGKQWGRYFICLAHIICCCKTAKIPYRQNHGYPEYWYRSQTALNEKSNLQNITLDDLYNEFMSGDRTRVATRFM